MRLHGSTEANLISANRSARKLRSQAVHADTLKYWSDLAKHARHEMSSRDVVPSESLNHLIADLELAIVQRKQHG